MSDIKSISITGGAAADISGSKKRRSTKKRQEGGSDEVVRGVSPIINAVKGVESTTSFAATSSNSNSNTWLKYPANSPVPPQIIPAPSHVPRSPDMSAAPTGQYAQAGGKISDHKSIKVELKKKGVTKKVHLNPKKSDAPKQGKKHQTKKSRKVTLGVSTLHRRITRAKKLHKNVKEMPLDALKAKLIKGGLIKANSKAPESVLRQIAADADVVAKKAL
jgi:hypothetical protein